MSLLRTLTFISAFAFLLKISYTQQETELNLRHVIDNAVKSNANIVKLQNSIEGQQSIIKTRYGNLFPTLSISTGWTRTNQVTQGENTYNGITFYTDPKNETSNNYNLSLRSDVTLFNGFTNYESIDIAKMTEVNLYTQMEKVKQDIIIKVLSDYITVLKNNQIVKINTASLEDSRAQLDKIKLFVEAGKRTKSDVYRQDVQVAQNELAVEQAKNNLEKSVADLVYSARLPQEKTYSVNLKEFDVNVSYETLEAFVIKNSNIESLVLNALKNRYDYKSSLQNLIIYESNIEIARNSLIFPTLSGFGSYSFSGRKIQNIDDSRVFTVGLTLSYPIFQGFSIENQRQQALVSYKSANEDVKQLKDQISLEIKKAMLDLKSLLKQIEITERNIRSAEQDKYSAEESYRVGLGTVLEIQTATTNYNNLLIDKSNLIYNFLFAQKQLEYYQGLLRY